MKYRLFDENTEHCKRIADQLYKIAIGEIYKDENGNEYDLTKVDQIIREEFTERMELEEYTMMDYFQDALDINYVVDFEKEYKAIRLLVTFGGPNIYVDTCTGKVELYWWTDRAEWNLEREAIEEIDFFGRELYEC